jgi:hypothetical protein
MHNKHGKAGIVAMSVSLDEPEDEKLMKNVRTFLKEQKATFQNFVLNETQETWVEKLGIAGPPAIFVFGLDGKLAKRYPEPDKDVDYKEIEKFALELLKKK